MAPRSLSFRYVSLAVFRAHIENGLTVAIGVGLTGLLTGAALDFASAIIAATGDAIAQAFNDLRNLDPDAVRKQRRQKFLDIGRKLG